MAMESQGPDPESIAASCRRDYSYGSVSLAICLGFFAGLISASSAQAQVDPWVEATLYNAGEEDSAGLYPDSPWAHPPPQDSEADWGLLSATAWREGTWRKRASITGSWGGFRDKLFREYGVALAAGYGGQLSGNPVGGEKQGVSYVQHAGASLFVDLERSIGWKRGYFIASMNANWGKGLSHTDIGNLFAVQYASQNPSVRLLNLALIQTAFDDNVEIAVGRLIMANDFGGSPAFCVSVNQAVCATPISAVYAVSFGTYPYATWGGRIKLQPQRNWYVQAGVYATYPSFRTASDHGVRFGLPKEAGPILLAEAGFIHGSWLNQPGVEGPFPQAGARRGGKIKLGGYSSWEVVKDQKTQQTQRGGAWGLYLIVEQDLINESANPLFRGGFGGAKGQGLDGFLSLSYSSEETSQLAWMAAAGLVYTGLVPGRERDVTGLIFSYGRFSNDLRDYQRASGQNLQHYELLLELNYRIEITNGLFIQPDIQGVIKPNGYSDIPSALVLSMNFGFAF